MTAKSTRLLFLKSKLEKPKRWRESFEIEEIKLLFISKTSENTQ